MGNDAIIMPCFKFLIRHIKTQEDLLVFAKNYFMVANAHGVSESDAVMGYVAFRSALTRENSFLQLTLFKGKTLPAQDFRKEVLGDVTIPATGKCQLYAEMIDPLVISPIKKRNASSLCNMCVVTKGTKKYHNVFEREEIALIRFICDSYDNLDYFEKLIEPTKPDAWFKCAVCISDEIDTDHPVIIPINMLFVRMLSNVGKDFYSVSAESTNSENVLRKCLENKSALFSSVVRKYAPEQILGLQELAGIAYQDLFRLVFDEFVKNIVSCGVPSREYVSQVINTMLKENGSLKRKKTAKKQVKDENIPPAPMFRLADVLSDIDESDKKESDAPAPIKVSGEVKAEDGTTLVYMNDSDFADFYAHADDSDGVDELPFAPSAGIEATKLSEVYADELPDYDEPDEPDELVEPMADGDEKSFAGELEELDEPEEPDEPDVNDDEEYMPFEDNNKEDINQIPKKGSSENVDISAVENEPSADESPFSEETAKDDGISAESDDNMSSVAITNNTPGVIVPSENSALYLPQLSDEILRTKCVYYDEHEHGEVLGELLEKSSSIPVEIFLTDSKGYGLILFDRLHFIYYITLQINEPTIVSALKSQSIAKVCWQPYFLYSHCRSLGIDIRSVHSLFSSNAVFNPPLPYIPRANTLKAYLDVWRTTHKFRLRKTDVVLLDEMQCYTLTYRMQLNSLSGTKALQANYLRDEVLGRSFMRRTMFNDNGCLFDIDKEKGQIHYNANTDISCKEPGLLLTYILEQDNLTTQAVFHLYMRALIMLAGKGFFRKLPIQLMLMDSDHGIMQLFVGRRCYDLVKTNLQVYFNTYAIEHAAERFRLYVDAQIQEPPGTARVLPSYNLLPQSIDDALDLYSTSDVTVPVANSHIIKPMLARKATGNAGKVASFPPMIDS